jgi:hypothetical protein
MFFRPDLRRPRSPLRMPTRGVLPPRTPAGGGPQSAVGLGRTRAGAGQCTGGRGRSGVVPDRAGPLTGPMPRVRLGEGSRARGGSVRKSAPSSRGHRWGLVCEEHVDVEPAVLTAGPDSACPRRAGLTGWRRDWCFRPASRCSLTPRPQSSAWAKKSPTRPKGVSPVRRRTSSPSPTAPKMSGSFETVTGWCLAAAAMALRTRRERAAFTPTGFPAQLFIMGSVLVDRRRGRGVPRGAGRGCRCRRQGGRSGWRS